MATKRQVQIEVLNDTFFVKYVKRNFGQRYSAAQFNMNQSSYEDVVTWIKNNPKIELVDNVNVKEKSLEYLANLLVKDLNVRAVGVRQQRLYFQFNGINMAVVLNPN